MKSTLVWCLIVLNVLLLGALVGRSMKPNAAMAQAAGGVAGGRPGDYSIIPVDFPGAPTGAVVVIDNVTGNMSAISTDESKSEMRSVPRINVNRLFDQASNGRRGR